MKSNMNQSQKPYQLKANYHSHTLYCNHAANSMEEMILAAIENNYQVIGISEHAPLLVERTYRLNLDENDKEGHNVTKYLEEGKQLKEKYQDKIKVLIGFEAEYHKDQFNYYKWLRGLNGCDFLIMGNHNVGNPHLAQIFDYTNNDVLLYAQQIVDACESGLFSMIGHPDYIFKYVEKWNKDCETASIKIIEAAEKANLPLCFNIKGLSRKRKDLEYPTDQFWKLVKNYPNVKIKIECDAHSKVFLDQKFAQMAYDLLTEWELTNQLIEFVDLK